MPIIRRSFGEAKQETVNVPKASSKKTPAPKQVVPPKPAKIRKTLPVQQVAPRLAVKTGGVKIVRRWPQADEQYVTIERGIVTVRTPKECTNWQQEFRKRIVSDYREPATLVDKASLDRLYDPETVYAIGGRRLKYRQPIEILDNARGKAVIIRTEIIDIDGGKAMTLQHPDPAMRVLMVYAFIKRLSFSGVASFSVYDWQPDT